MSASAPSPGTFSFKMISVTAMLISFGKTGGDWYVRMIQLSSTRGDFVWHLVDKKTAALRMEGGQNNCDLLSFFAIRSNAHNFGQPSRAAGN
jgi:hypothetical protein